MPISLGARALRDGMRQHAVQPSAASNSARKPKNSERGAEAFFCGSDCDRLLDLCLDVEEAAGCRLPRARPGEWRPGVGRVAGGAHFKIQSGRGAGVPGNQGV